MTSEDFKLVVDRRIESCRNKLFGDKEAEYSRGNDRLHNFKVAAAIDSETPERSLWGMWKKHIVSIKDLVDDIESGKDVPSDAYLGEKFDDMINYVLLLEGLLRDR